MFRSTSDGGVAGKLSADEAKLLRALVDPVLDLLGDGSKPPARKPPAETDVFDELERMFSEEDGDSKPEAPTDPVLARLLPDAYADDPESAGEFRKYTESSLREAKKYFAQVMLDTLPENGGKVRLTGDQARDWMRALNDVRLMFGVRLEVSEDFEEQLAALPPDDPSVPVFEVYGWLGAVQESLVQALAR
ncbi:MAG: DUF2017 domain-containing protein [Streptosporangiales bacterium]|jgi:hypothetical protein|nr:DUF2017 domain-containing protein [Streptosporangiales bacterium]